MENMKPIFIRCSCEETEYHRCKIYNKPVNLNLCISIYKYKEAYYPDNEGTAAIRFDMVGNASIQWVYSKSQTKERDADFEMILGVFKNYETK